MSNFLKGTISQKELLSEKGATGILSDYKDNTDPKYIGPGIWNIIHQRAYSARTNQQQLSYISFMKETCYTFPCLVCKGHCTEYIKNHPLEDYLSILVDIDGSQVALGMFVWSWKFHNAVNTRLGKTIMNWNTSYNIFSDTENKVCSKNCLDAGIAHSAPILPPKIILGKVDNIGTTGKQESKTFKLISQNRK